MPMRAIRVLLVVWVAVGLAFPATAQQATPRPSPPPAQQDALCDAFTKSANGDWVAKKDVMVPGPGGMMQLKAGQAAEESERLAYGFAEDEGEAESAAADFVVSGAQP